MACNLTSFLATRIDFRVPESSALETFFLQHHPATLAGNPTINSTSIDALLSVGLEREAEESAILANLLKVVVLSTTQKKLIAARASWNTLSVLLEYQAVGSTLLTQLLGRDDVAVHVAQYMLRRPGRFRLSRSKNLDFALERCDLAELRVAWLTREPQRFMDRAERWVREYAMSGAMNEDVTIRLLEARPELVALLVEIGHSVARVVVANSRHLTDVTLQRRVVGLTTYPLDRLALDSWVTTHSHAIVLIAQNPRCHLAVLREMNGRLSRIERPLESANRAQSAVTARLTAFERQPTVSDDYESVEDYASLSYVLSRYEFVRRTTTTDHAFNARALLANPNVAAWRKRMLARQASRGPHENRTLTGSWQYASPTARSAQTYTQAIPITSPLDGDVPVHIARAILAKEPVGRENPSTQDWWGYSLSGDRALALALASRLNYLPTSLEVFFALRNDWHVSFDELVDTAALLGAHPIKDTPAT